GERTAGAVAASEIASLRRPCPRAPPTLSRAGLVPTSLAVDVTRGTRARLRPVRTEAGSRCPQRAEVDGRVAGLPAAEEALDRRVQNDPVEVLQAEEAVAADRGVVRRHCLEGARAEVAGEDDVDDVLRGEATHGSDRVDDRDRSFDRQVFVDADLFRELAV